MNDNIATSFPSVLYEYEKRVELTAKRINRMAILLKEDVNIFTIMFEGSFKEDNAYEDLKGVTNDDSINAKHLEMYLNQCLSNVQNDFQALAFQQAIERIRESWFGYLEGIKTVIEISQAVNEELEKITQKKRSGSFNYARALEGTPYILSFAVKFFGIFDVINKYYDLLINRKGEDRRIIDAKEQKAYQIEQPDNWKDKNNNFNQMPLQVVEKWFMQLATTKNHNSEPFLPVKQVHQFIERAFVGNDDMQKITLNIAYGDKGRIIGLFHLFFGHCIKHFPKTGKIDKTAKAKKYIELLTENFDNWTFDEVKDNFRDGGNWREPV